MAVEESAARAVTSYGVHQPTLSQEAQFIAARQVQLPDPSSWAAVRDPADSSATWCLCAVKPGSRPPVLEVVTTGAGGVGGLVAELDPKRVLYAGLAFAGAEDVDDTRSAASTASTRFVAIVWVGGEAGMMDKARAATQAVDAVKYFAPFDAEMEANDASEVTAATITAKLEEAAAAAVAAAEAAVAAEAAAAKVTAEEKVAADTAEAVTAVAAVAIADNAGGETKGDKTEG